MRPEPAQATYEVAYCEDPDQPGIESHHAYHLLSAERYAADGEMSWLLLAPLELAAGVHGPNRASGPATRGCGWPGCPGAAMAFSPVRLLQHIRQAHGGQIDDGRLRWACGVRCVTCAQPFAAGSLRQHLRRDPATGERRCPSAARAPSDAVRLTDADLDFVRGLTVDECYIQGVPSLVTLDRGSARAVGAAVAQLLERCVAAPTY